MESLNLEHKFGYEAGEEILIKIKNGKQVIKKFGRVVWTGEIFVCLWLCSLTAPEKYGYRECFFYNDFANGNVIIKKLLVKEERKLA